MIDLKFPLSLKFDIKTIANDFLLTDANEETVCYVYQKLLPLKSDILIYSDKNKSKLLYRIILEGPLLSFDVSLLIYDSKDQYIARLRHPSFSTNWTGHYEVYDQNENIQFDIYEDTPWTKVWNDRLKGIPILNMFTGYFFNPSFTLTNVDSEQLFQLKKDSTLLGNKYSLDKKHSSNSDHQERAILSLITMIMLEKIRG